MNSLESIAIICKSLEYKNDIPKFVEYIRNNKAHFPFIKEDELKKLSKSN